MLLAFLLVFLASVCLCAFLTRFVRGFALSRNWVDFPDAGRHLHGKAVPRLGGVAIFLTFLFLAAAGVLVHRLLETSTSSSIRTAVAILVPAALIFVVGLYDDFRTLGHYVKFGAQFSAACLLYFEGMGIHRLTFLFGAGHLRDALGLPLTVLWVLLITNAFNLIDGLDGLAAGAALFSTMVLLVLFLVDGNQFVAFLAVVLAGAIAGFLRFNFNPATIFLGDSGSLFIGFVLSALALAGSQKASTMVAVAIPVVCFGLPILDVAIAVVRRFLNGRPLFEGDREHIHHRLLQRGFSQRHAVLILYGVSALFGLLSLALLRGGETTALALVVLGMGVCVGVPQLRYQEFKEMRRILERTAGQKQIIANNLHVRRAADSLRSCTEASQLRRILVAALEPSEFDGFRLNVSSRARFSRSFPGCRKPGSGNWRCSWTRTGYATADWQLKLDLVAEDGEKCGTLTIFRRLTGKPLMMDINLLGDGFQSALAAAVRRTILDAPPFAVQIDRKLSRSLTKVASA